VSRVVWNKYIRITHWLVAGIIILNLYFLEEGDPAHRYLGYTVFGLVCIRIIYGFINQTGEHAFSKFPLNFSKLLLFIKSKLKGTDSDYSGHNPAAAWTYIILWICVVGLGVTGWMMGLDLFFGEEWLEITHEIISQILQLCILAHLLGIALDAKRFKRKTWLGMITGRK
jgi:cytochrome b